ncbi:hypothetical protein F383_24326 [Gossypium arboreum]|uniref:Uncharacterized protein n=1 Tax=Gossypium arboreum TaxID=29729 RepID=A0A0B0NWQ9_GOSAR|nr:hypothetical protein F383_24326 [Gossypium arboreum]
MSSSFNISFICISHVNLVEFLRNPDRILIIRQFIRMIILYMHSREPYIIWRDYQSRLNPSLYELVK